jgi:hypothetical protein
MAVLGMRGNGDWVTDQRPKNWREKVLQLYPNGDAPLTAVMSMMKSERTDDPEFNWWTKSLATQAATVTNVYTEATHTTAYTTGGAAGDVLYVNTSTTADTQQFRAGHQVLLINTANYADNTNAKVVSVTPNGASSQIVVKLLEADPTTTGLADCNRILAIGNINAEGGVMPSAIAYDPTKHYNYTQIFRTPLSITRTARKTRLRTGDQYKEAKREALELHSIEMEKSALWGIRTEGTGDNGKPERTSGGLIKNIIDNSGTVSNYGLETDTAYTGKTWLQAGEEWLDEQLMEIFRYGGTDRMAFGGTDVINAINKLAKEYGQYQLSSNTAEYGIKVKTWVTPFGDIHIKVHPLFSYETSYRKSLIIFDPKDLVYRYIDDTTFYAEGETQNTGRGRIDGTDEEYLTECGYEFHHPSKCGFLSGFGDDNSVS